MKKKIFLLFWVAVIFTTVDSRFAFSSKTPAETSQETPQPQPDSPSESTDTQNSTNSTQSSAVIADQKVFASVEKLNVDPTTGTATLSIPFNVPAGRAGIQPNISLLYNSSGGNSVAGMGWNLELGSIQRSTKRGTPKYNSSDTFILTQAGSTQELVYDSNVGFYRMKIEGAFMKIASVSDYWVVTDKKGTKYTFGQTNASRVYDPFDAARVFRWMLDRVEDISGNYMLISYIRDNNQLYPDEIQYTGNTQSLTPFASIKFEYQSRSDQTENFVAGFRLGTYLRFSSIDAKVGANRLRKYQFAYSQGTETQRSILTGVTQLGSDGTSALPSTNFNYSTGTTNFIGQHNISNHPNDHVGNGLSRIIDMNNDGLPDLIRSPSNGWPYDIFVNNGNWDFSGPYRTTNHPSEQLNTNNYELVDLNGDSLPDILYGQINSYQVWLNNGNNDFNPPFTVANSPDIWMGNPNVRVMDMNADGYPDLLQSGQGGTNPPYRIFLNNGSGNFTSVISVNNAPSLGIDNPNVRLADFNGDGLIDFIFGEYNQYRIWINNGQNGFNPPVSANNFPNGQWLSNPLIQLADMNGDGLTDLLESESSGAYYIYYNNGKVDFNPRIAVSNPPFWPTNNPNVKLIDMNADGLTDAILGKPYQVYLNNGQNGFYPPISINSWPNADMDDSWNMLVDFNGDGLTDFLRGTVAENPAYRVYPNNNSQASSRPNVLVQMDNSIGATTNLEYKNSIVKALGPSQYKYAFSPTLFNTVRATTTAVQSQSYRTDYQFKNGIWNYSEREFRGFQMARVIDSDGNYSQTTFAQDNIFKGRPLRQETYDSSGNLFGKSENTWDVQDLGSGIKFVFLKQKDDFLYDGNATGRRTQEKYFYDESPQLGNLTKAISMGEVDLTSGADSGSDKRTVESEYLNNTSNWLIGFPKMVIAKNNADIMVRQSWLFYDGSESQMSLPTQGLLTKSELWAGGGAGAVNPVTRYTYDSFGNLKTSVDPNNNTTTMTYDTAYQLFPLKTKNAINHEVTNEFYGIDGVALDSGDGYRGLWGQLKSTTDPNAQKGRKTYDTFGRVVATVSPLDSINFPTTTIDYEFASSYVKIKAHSREKTGQSGTIDSAQFYDGLGRLIQTKSEAETPGQFIVIGQTEYNSRGLPVKKYFSFFSNNSIDSIDPINTSGPKSTLLYDAMGRAVRTTNPDGTYASASYDDWETSAINENGHKQKSIFDAYGRLIRKEEFTGADGRSPHFPANAYTLYASTQYVYDSEGNLTQTQDAQGNFTAIAYDALGRKISLNDPDMGVWQYTYDVAGNLKSQTDAKGRKIDFNYDALNRLSKKSSINGVANDLNVDYTYDEAVVTNSKGRLTKAAYDLNGDTKFAYDIVGRENESTKKIDGFNYGVKRSYDALSRLADLEFPDASKVFYDYNAAGQIERVYTPGTSIPGGNVNLTTFTENDPTSKIVVTSDCLTYSSIDTRVTNAYIYKDYTALTNFTHTLDGKVSSSATYSGETIIWGASDTPADTYEDWQNGIYLGFYRGGDSAVVLKLGQVLNQSWAHLDTSVNLTIGTRYYIKVIKSGLTVTAKIYLDSAMTNLKDTLIANLTIPDSMRYLYAFSTRTITSPPGKYMSGDVCHLNSGEAIVTPGVEFVKNVDYNAAGQITRIDFGNGNTTTYSYDPQTLRLTRLMTYDLQLTTLQDLNYTYDSSGNIVQITDAVNTASQGFEYDALNRLIEANGNYGTKQYAYDPIGNLILKDGINYYYGESAAGPHAVSSASDGSVFQYDQNGNMVKMTKGGIVSDYIYDAENRLKEVKKAAATQAKFEYDGDGGRTKKIAYTYSYSGNPTGCFLAGTPILMADGSTKPIESIQKGDKVVSFDEKTKVKVVATVSNTAVHNGMYQEHLLINGSLRVTGNHLFYSQGQWVTAEHLTTTSKLLDSNLAEVPIINLERVELASPVTVYDITIDQYHTFFAGGFLVHNKAYPNPDELTFNRTDRLFDLNNYIDYMTVFASSLFSVRDAEAGTTITTTTTKFVGSLYEEANNSPVSYIFLGGTRIASVNNGQVLYYHADHLGGTNLLTDDSGTIKELIEYEPYGLFSRHEKYGTAQEVANFYFTGKQFDSESGLYFFGGRYYNPAIGRFVTADIFVPYPENPQTFNRYTYVYNNPVNLIDPTGHFPWVAFIAGVIQGATAGTAIGAGLAAITGGDIGNGAVLGAISGIFFSGTTMLNIYHGIKGGLKILAYAEAGAYSGALGAVAIGEDPGRGASFGALSGAVFGSIGDLGGKSWKWDLGRIALAGIAGGGISELAGGSFLDGFILAGSIAGADFVYRAILSSQGKQGASMKTATKPGQPKQNAKGGPIKGNSEVILHDDFTISQPGMASKSSYAPDDFWGRFLNFIGGETGPVMNFLGKYIPGFQGLSLAHDITGNFLKNLVGNVKYPVLFNFQTMPPIYGLNLAGSAINDSPGLIGLYKALEEGR